MCSIVCGIPKIMKITNVFRLSTILLILLAVYTGSVCGGRAQETNMIVLTNNVGVQWELQREAGGWALGQVLLHGKPVDNPLLLGVICLHPQNNSGDVWLLAANAVQVDSRTATLSGSQLVNGVMFRFEVAVGLNENLPEAQLIPHWSVNQNLNGWDVALAYHGVGQGNWSCTMYPAVGNLMTEPVGNEGGESQYVTNGTVDIERLASVGVPAMIIFRPDMSLVTLFGIAPAFDYLDYTNWTANTGFYFQNQATPPEFRVGPNASTVGTSNFIAGVKYVMPLQIFLNDSSNSVQAISQLAGDWVKANHYAVQPMFIRTPDQALALFLQGRRNSPAWIPSEGYEIQAGNPYLYNADSAQSAYFEYLIYTNTGDSFWRERSLEQMNFLLQAVVTTNTSSPLFGCMNSGYDVGGGFESNDRGSNPGYKVDVNVCIARYMLQTWALFKEYEGINHQDWYQTALNAANWALAQRNPDGGLPQLLDYNSLTPSMSVASGRTMAALPVIAGITGNTNYLTTAQSLEGFITNNVEGRYWFTGQHPDLPAWTFESDSVWGLCEYWLDKYNATGNSNYLQRAEADGWIGFLMLCPKQLRWVANPTQTCHAEQTYYAQYSNYCYQNEKLKCLYQLGQLTGEDVFTRLFNRIAECQFWCEVTTGPYTGAQYERMADPWECVSSDVNSTGSAYINELSLSANLQLLEMGMDTNVLIDDSQ